MWGCATTPRNKAFNKYPAGVNGHTTLIYYDIQGRTLEDLTRDMRRLARTSVPATSELHESGHKDISAKAAHEVRRQLRGMTDLCSQGNPRANELARRILDQAVVEQIAYDVTTRHGLTQGATIGPVRRAPLPINKLD